MQHFLSMIPSTEAVVLPELNHLMQLRDPKPGAELTASFLSRRGGLEIAPPRGPDSGLT
jgi:hypothetical protein